MTNMMLSLVSRIQAARVTAEEEGQTLVEYSLIIALVAILLIGALTALQGSIGGVFTAIGNALDAAV